mmetsp:Transcript_12848/g.33046  ORF Transcript_12848/g.33046 Transcript_12848/m.33046 type:complete len:297 (-) Transcript_12848:34-924(-)
MEMRPHLPLVCIALAILPLRAEGSANGLLYQCKAADLAANPSTCTFEGSSSFVGTFQGQSNADIAFEPDARRRGVCDKSGKQLLPAPKPFEDGVKLCSSASELTGDDLIWSRYAELILPLRDALMYRAKEMAAELPSTSTWDKYTRAFKDCAVKTTPDYRKDGDKGPMVYSYDSIRGLVVDAGGVDTHNGILQFIEEGSMELACLMVSYNLKEPECSDMEERSGVAMSTRSTCWHAAYKGLWGEDPVLPAEGETSQQQQQQKPPSSSTSSLARGWGLLAASCAAAALLALGGVRRL